ncbi:single-strand DNA-binding protein [Nocardioides thalensis]|uniref:Single-strand DNA-binding protein n=1 Tax=Nocardioides thalensis TaxID=1914755 RepID=A0A853C1L9_9ACTN|nr:single-stranded DNA-binding protein [Nocardioides thalensis]NYJ01505.1 single-strand DNA-binding protein [Nocardioides thalensis]
MSTKDRDKRDQSSKDQSSKDKSSTARASEEPACNEVRLQGRVSGTPEVRELPSGDALVLVRVVVARVPVRPRADGRRSPSVDVIDCAAWDGRARRAIASWQEGDEVALVGALRRRFFRAGGQTASRVEVEVSSARRLRRAASG